MPPRAAQEHETTSGTDPRDSPGAAAIIAYGLSMLLRFGDAIGIPGILMLPLGLIRWLVWPAALVLSIIFAVNASNRQRVRIPLISGIAEGQL